MKAMLMVRSSEGEMLPEYTKEMKQPKSLGLSDIRQFLADAAERLSAEGRAFSTCADPRSYYANGSGISTWQATSSKHFSSGGMESFLGTSPEPVTFGATAKEEAILRMSGTTGRMRSSPRLCETTNIPNVPRSETSASVRQTAGLSVLPEVKQGNTNGWSGIPIFGCRSCF